MTRGERDPSSSFFRFSFSFHAYLVVLMLALELDQVVLHLEFEHDVSVQGWKRSWIDFVEPLLCVCNSVWRGGAQSWQAARSSLLAHAHAKPLPLSKRASSARRRKSHDSSCWSRHGPCGASLGGGGIPHRSLCGAWCL